MSGLRSRRKGHSFERKVANDFKSIGYPDAKRQLEYQVDECIGIDIANTGRFKLQCKNKKAYCSVNTIEEIQADAFDIPVVVTKADRKPARVIMNYDDFLEIVKGYEGELV